MKRPDDKSPDKIGQQARRMQEAQQHPVESPLRGVSVFGIIGWSIALPTVLGAFLGVWLDKTSNSTFSWTIALILGGLALGILIAWSWMDKERNRR